MNKLEAKYQKVDFKPIEGAVSLICYKEDNVYIKLLVSKDILGTKPKVTIDNKRVGFIKFSEQLEEYEFKEKRILDTDGLIIQYKHYTKGKNWEVSPEYSFNQDDFIESFNHKFLL